MGKKGDLLRAQKAESVKYTFTSSQLLEHDRFVINQYKQRIKDGLTADMEKKYSEHEEKLREVVRTEWDAREKVLKGEGWEDNFMTLLSMLLAVSSRVLVERFHWKPIPKDCYFDKRNRLARFGDCIVDEINSICTDEMKDIRRYCEEVDDLYGVRFKTGGEDGN